MNTAAERSLHYLVQKWLAPTLSARIRVIQFGRMGGEGARFVHVEASTPTGPRALFFFRHDDGCWCVFPPRVARPAMNGFRTAA